MNRRFGTSNVTYVVRVEFERQGYKDNRIRRHFKRFWLPGAMWVERSVRSHMVHHSNLTVAKTRNLSHVDIWLVKPKCFIRHNGIARIHRVAKSLKTNIDHLRWLAKVNFDDEERYGPREVMEIGKAMAKVTGVQCTWMHPGIQST